LARPGAEPLLRGAHPGDVAADQQRVDRPIAQPANDLVEDQRSDRRAARVPAALQRGSRARARRSAQCAQIESGPAAPPPGSHVLQQSIKDPNVFVVPGFPKGVMRSNSGRKLKPAQISGS
jgi:hypothetical protein